MTLIELLVAMVIGLGVTLVVASILVVGENHKRTTTSTNDADQTGSYAFYAISKALRGAGSALVEGNFVKAGLFGCSLHVNGFLPRTAPFPAPFENFLSGVTQNLVVAPLLIAAGQSEQAASPSAPASDVIVLMSGSGADGGVSRPIYSAGTINGSPVPLNLQTTQGFNGNDLVILSQNGQPGCDLEEVEAGAGADSITPTVLPIGTNNTHYFNTVNLATLVGSTNTYVTPIGNSTANNVQFELFGIGSNDTLYSYDLLQNQNVFQGTGDSSQAIADGVIQMNALYGVATTALPTVFNNWANPADVADKYDINDLMVSPVTMATIIAVRVAIVVRGQYYDKNVVSPNTITFFNNLVDGNGVSLTKTINLTADQTHYRYRVFEFTVPLRNMLVLAGA